MFREFASINLKKLVSGNKELFVFVAISELS